MSAQVYQVEKCVCDWGVFFLGFFLLDSQNFCHEFLLCSTFVFLISKWLMLLREIQAEEMHLINGCGVGKVRPWAQFSLCMSFLAGNW